MNKFKPKSLNFSYQFFTKILYAWYSYSTQEVISLIHEGNVRK